MLCLSPRPHPQAQQMTCCRKTLTLRARALPRQIIHMANDTSLIPASQDAAADPDFVAGSGLASATPSSTMRGALEAMHSVDLGHPNIVQTYKSTQRLVQVGLARSGSPGILWVQGFS